MRLFTLEEANALLPQIRQLFLQIDKSRATFRQLEPEVKRASERANAGDGGTVYGVQYADALNRFMSSVHEILSRGIEIKDFDRGLCDFPSEREGRVVYLCWQRGEERI